MWKNETDDEKNSLWRPFLQTNNHPELSNQALKSYFFQANLKKDFLPKTSVDRSVGRTNFYVIIIIISRLDRYWYSASRLIARFSQRQRFSEIQEISPIPEL